LAFVFGEEDMITWLSYRETRNAKCTVFTIGFSTSIGETKFQCHVMSSLKPAPLGGNSKIRADFSHLDDNANFKPFSTHIAINRYAIPSPLNPIQYPL